MGAGPAAPAIAEDGTVYVANDENLYSLKANGTLKWKSAISYAARTSPAIGADGTIYVGSGDGNLYAINSDGTRKWAFTTGSFVDSSPAIGDDGTIYFGSGYSNAKLYAVTPQGAQRWAFASGTRASFSPPAIGADGNNFFRSFFNLFIHCTQVLTAPCRMQLSKPARCAASAEVPLPARATMLLGVLEAARARLGEPSCQHEVVRCDCNAATSNVSRGRAADSNANRQCPAIRISRPRWNLFNILFLE